MKKIEAWETADGKVFTTELEAAQHEFTTYATNLVGESAAVAMAQNAADFHQRLGALLKFTPAPAAPTGGNSNPFGKVSIPLVWIHENPKALDAILAAGQTSTWHMEGSDRVYIMQHSSFRSWQYPSDMPYYSARVNSDSTVTFTELPPPAKNH